METARRTAVLQALLVTFLWSTSFILIKWGIKEIPALPFAGLRYMLAFFILLPFLFTQKFGREMRALTKRQWVNLFLLGIVFYAFTQGTQFIGLYYLPAVTVSLMLNTTPLIVIAFGILFLGEYPSLIQWVGSVCFITGVYLYFFPVSLPAGRLTGIIVMTVGIAANAVAAILGRSVNRTKVISPLIVTAVSMGIGAAILLAVGIAFYGIPGITLKGLMILLWLAGINTAFAFTLWNRTLRHLTAYESSIINGTMLIQIAVLSRIFLSETITVQEGAGMLLSAVGIVLVQMKRN